MRRIRRASTCCRSATIPAGQGWQTPFESTKLVKRARPALHVHAQVGGRRRAQPGLDVGAPKTGRPAGVALIERHGLPGRILVERAPGRSSVVLSEQLADVAPVVMLVLHRLDQPSDDVGLHPGRPRSSQCLTHVFQAPPERLTFSSSLVR